MTDSHDMSIEALDQLQQVLVKIPPHHRAQIQLQVDRASVYQRVLTGWDRYFDSAKNITPLIHRMVHKLIACGTPSVSGSGSIIAHHPGKGPEIQAWLGVGIKSGQKLAAWLDDCPLIKKHPDLPGQLMIFGTVEDLQQGDAYLQLPLIDAEASPRTDSSLDNELSGGEFFDRGNPEDLDSALALQHPIRPKKMDALALQCRSARALQHPFLIGALALQHPFLIGALALQHPLFPNNPRKWMLQRLRSSIEEVVVAV